MFPFKDDTPQWSPPLRGGSTPSAISSIPPAPDQPQWSPPLRGGSTHIADGDVAALDPAAMEPAVERREHLWHAAKSRRKQLLPQWSPPLRGGSTDALEEFLNR